MVTWGYIHLHVIMQQTFSLEQFPDYGLWFYLLIGTLIAALMQASAATIAIVLTDINGPRGGFDTSCRVRVFGRAGWSLTASDVDREIGTALSLVDPHET